ncbi:hypothetical protein, partial [Pseudomonas viridiflava]|uniref:hypothetical protein n=1 Tax=Pseudomonas viridiflava TaxID=33069 RepID=UPI0019D0ECDD
KNRACTTPRRVLSIPCGVVEKWGNDLGRILRREQNARRTAYLACHDPKLGFTSYIYCVTGANVPFGRQRLLIPVTVILGYITPISRLVATQKRRDIEHPFIDKGFHLC